MDKKDSSKIFIDFTCPSCGEETCFSLKTILEIMKDDQRVSCDGCGYEEIDADTTWEGK